jgi:branched-chain amino acid transport system substrate-binding protein
MDNSPNEQPVSPESDQSAPQTPTGPSAQPDPQTSPQPSVQPPQVNPPAASPSPAGPAKSHHATKLMAIVLAAVVVLGGAGYGLYAHNKSTKPKPLPNVKIGVMLAFSGGSSSMGYGSNKGIQLAQKQLGAYNMQLVQADDQCDPTVAVTAVKYLISQHVAAIIGDNCSSAVTATLPYVNANKILLLSPSATSPLLSIKNDYFFRTVPSDDGQGAFLAKTAYADGHRKLAVFYTSEPYGTAIDSVVTQNFKALGGTVVATASAPSSVIDIASQVAAIKASNPDAVIIVTNSTVSSVAFMKQARAAGIVAPFYGGDNLYDNTIITNGGTAAEGLKVVTYPTGTPAFKQALLTQYNVSDQLYAAPEAYDAFKTLYLAIQKGATTGPEFKQILPTIKFNGASGPIYFNQYGEPNWQTYKYALLQVKDGSFTQLN